MLINEIVIMAVGKHKNGIVFFILSRSSPLGPLIMLAMTILLKKDFSQFSYVLTFHRAFHEIFRGLNKAQLACEHLIMYCR